jgi:hypothetical protein
MQPTGLGKQIQDIRQTDYPGESAAHVGAWKGSGADGGGDGKGKEGRGSLGKGGSLVRGVEDWGGGLGERGVGVGC